MKQASTILLLLIVLLQTFSRFVVEADYFLNRSYIAKVLCINKTQPERHCKGKCYLAKQLKEQQKQDHETPVTKKAKSEVQLFNLLEQVQVIVSPQQNKVEHLPSYLLHLTSFPRSVFRPPIV